MSVRLGVTLNGFETETTWRGQGIDTQQIYPGIAPNLPEFLTPGQTYSTAIDLSSLSGQVTATENTHSHFNCTIVTWYHP
jgi:hypothetical protein